MSRVEEHPAQSTEPNEAAITNRVNFVFVFMLQLKTGAHSLNGKKGCFTTQTSAKKYMLTLQPLEKGHRLRAYRKSPDTLVDTKLISPPVTFHSLHETQKRDSTPLLASISISN